MANTEKREVSLYEIYMGIDRLLKATKKVGGTASSINVNVDVSGADTYFWNNNIVMHIHPASESVAEEREQVTAALMEMLRGTILERKNGAMTLRGELSTGVSFYLFCGDGVCERVQVGTQTVLRPDPEAPMIEVVEPVFEVRCIDPLAEMIGA